MTITDAQVHVWGADTPQRPWPKRGPAHKAVPLSSDELLREMDAAGIDRAVLVPPSWEGDRNDLALAAAKSHPGRFAIMGRIDPETPQARGALANWRAQPGMLGMRFSFHTPVLKPLLTEGRVDWLWAEAQKHGVPLMILVRFPEVPLIARVAERFPGLKLVMDHMCLDSAKKDQACFDGFDVVPPLARFPNVAVKVTALPCYTSDAYPFRFVHPYVRRIYDAFGPRRMFWGTDLSRLPCTYRQCVSMFTEEMPWLSPADLEWVMGRGVCEWLGWRV